MHGSERETARDEAEPGPQLEPAPVPLVGLPLRKRLQKVPLNTYVRPATQQRMETLKDRGYAVTDIVDAALSEFLDRAGVPRDDEA